MLFFCSEIDGFLTPKHHYSPKQLSKAPKSFKKAPKEGTQDLPAPAVKNAARNEPKQYIFEGKLSPSRGVRVLTPLDQNEAVKRSGVALHQNWGYILNPKP